jgi:hypothetical protein
MTMAHEKQQGNNRSQQTGLFHGTRRKFFYPGMADS